MLLVKTKIGPSKIQGIGLFAAQFIPKGTVVQKFISGFDLVFSKEELKNFSNETGKQVLKYAYKSKLTGKYMLCSDDARFMNHSNNPNLKSNHPTEEIDVAARDIKKGDELTCNYKDFDADFNLKFRK